MKYMGSKARLAKNILPIILKDRKPNQWYVELFVGGGNLIDKVPGNRIGNDINPYLIAMWKKLSRGWIPSEISKSDYCSIRDDKDGFPPWLVGWVGFNCSYSGKFFGGFAGTITTKEGNQRNYQAEALRNTLRQVPKVKDVIF